MRRLADKNILITGGNSGIGLAAAQEFDREGARVAICGLNEGSLQAAKKTLGAGSLAVRADVSNLTDLDTMFATMPISADFPFTLKSVEVHGARMTYVDEGRGDPIVFLHGNPTSSYLWRNIIPYLTGLGRCIAPDLIGMGRSDKPELAYRFVDHARYVDSFLRALDLDRITFVLHDWGSALGFDWAMSHEGKVRGLAFMEAILGPMPSWDGFRPEGRESFQALRTPGVGERMVLE